MRFMIFGVYVTCTLCEMVNVRIGDCCLRPALIILCLIKPICIRQSLLFVITNEPRHTLYACFLCTPIDIIKQRIRRPGFYLRYQKPNLAISWLAELCISALKTPTTWILASPKNFCISAIITPIGDLDQIGI